MRFSTFGFLVVLPTLGLAKDCAVYYNWAGNSQKDVWRDLHAVSMCKDIGGSVPNDDLGSRNGNAVNRCSVCRNARDSTRDYDRTVTQGTEKLNFSVRCGWFAKGQCHA